MNKSKVAEWKREKVCAVCEMRRERERERESYSEEVW